jgi:DNA-binding LacI/PurR family transcriptional regulator
MRTLLNLRTPPDAVFCFADALAEGALHALRERGLSVPRDIALVGFDDVEEARYTAPPLTTVAPDKQELARLAVAALLSRIDVPAPASATPPTVVLAPHRLVIRESCGAQRATAQIGTPRPAADAHDAR